MAIPHKLHVIPEDTTGIDVVLADLVATDGDTGNCACDCLLGTAFFFCVVPDFAGCDLPLTMIRAGG